MSPVQRSNILRMLKEEAPEDRRIKKFPTPYKMDCTPYLQINFSESTYRYCGEEISFKGGSSLKLCKIIIIGDASVGKTCIVNRFCQKIFDSNYKSTIGVDFEVERFDILNIPYNLQIWDTAGQERFKSIAQSYYRGAHVIMLVFDLIKPESLSNCQVWLKEALQSSPCRSPLIFLVGTKKDLLKDISSKHMESSAIRLAKKLNAEYWVVSSKTGRNVEKLFYRIAVLAFEESIKLERDRKNNEIEIGTPLVSLKKNEKVGSKKTCYINSCSK
ncbi:hypothetical protein JTB14_030278 [Gonioctena quinquepunctata]|nr:hypothetical protein JTB14_030278 [Gonioctena quinquepunctata]